MRFLFVTLLLVVGQSPVKAQHNPLTPVQEADSVKITETNSAPYPAPGVPTDTVTPRNHFLKFKKIKEEETVDTIGIQDYKIISYARDTTFLDTTLTIQKEYKHNYLRKDDFELMPFANIGQPYNTLGKTFAQHPYYPRIGATAKHYNYFEVEDIPYYHVPTPMTELMLKTTLEEGQLLDALLTFNVTKRFNTSIAYKGFRSLGKYQFEQVISNNFRTTFSYTTPGNRYTLRGHITSQDIETQENGGLLNREQFEGGATEFENRSQIDVRYTDANNKVVGKRYFLDQQLALTPPPKKTTSHHLTQVTLGHEFTYETKQYQFIQSDQNDAFGKDPFVIPVEDRVRLKTMLNTLYTHFSNPTLGNIKSQVSLYHYNYFFNPDETTRQVTIPHQLQGEEITLGANYSKKIKQLSLKGDITYTLSGELTGNNINVQAHYQINKNYTLSGTLHLSSRMPDFNYLLYQSDYRNFNWQNTNLFQQQHLQNLQVSIRSKKTGHLAAAYSRIKNYTFFASTATPEEIENGQETAFVQPFQETNPIAHLRIKYTKEWQWKKWAVMNTILYQNVTQTNQVLNLPRWVTRNTLYFSSNVFKKAMFLQTGVTFKYFTSYNMDAYNPLLGEFFIQKNEAFGGYPLFDIFVNAKVRKARLYLKAEHFNALFSKPEYYAAPNYPYRDFVIRFGLVWNFLS